jgi:hypothetical protein
MFQNRVRDYGIVQQAVVERKYDIVASWRLSRSQVFDGTRQRDNLKLAMQVLQLRREAMLVAAQRAVVHDDPDTRAALGHGR